MAYVEVRFLVDGRLVWNRGREIADPDLPQIHRDVYNSLGVNEFLDSDALPSLTRLRQPLSTESVVAPPPRAGSTRGRYKAVLTELLAEHPEETLSREQALELYLDKMGESALNNMQRKGFNNAWRALREGREG